MSGDRHEVQKTYLSEVRHRIEVLGAGAAHHGQEQIVSTEGRVWAVLAVRVGRGWLLLGGRERPRAYLRRHAVTRRVRVDAELGRRVERIPVEAVPVRGRTIVAGLVDGCVRAIAIVCKCVTVTRETVSTVRVEGGRRPASLFSVGTTYSLHGPLCKRLISIVARGERGHEKTIREDDTFAKRDTARRNSNRSFSASDAPPDVSGGPNLPKIRAACAAFTASMELMEVIRHSLGVQASRRPNGDTPVSSNNYFGGGFASRGSVSDETPND